MMTLKEILQATGGKLICGNPNLRIRGISTDTRTIQRGEIFIALKGNNFDGHNFIKGAIKKYSCAAIVSKIGKKKYPKKFNLILVKNTTKALGDIARFHRSKFNIPIVVITGSCGKTTTKEMIVAILISQGYRMNLMTHW